MVRNGRSLHAQTIQVLLSLLTLLLPPLTLGQLFRDYLFHQVYDSGSPSVDFAHVVDCLNKLDVGTDEKILLMSRDETSVLVVRYSNLFFYLFIYGAFV